MPIAYLEVFLRMSLSDSRALLRPTHYTYPHDPHNVRSCARRCSSGALPTSSRQLRKVLMLSEPCLPDAALAANSFIAEHEAIDVAHVSQAR